MTRSEWFTVVGAGGALAALAWLFARDNGMMPIPVVHGPAPRPAGGVGWVPIEGESVVLVKGARYRACVDLGAFSPVRLFSDDFLAQKITERGFSAVRVLHGDAPPNWADTPADCSRYVDATWSRADERFDVPSQVEHAWRWVDA